MARPVAREVPEAQELSGAGGGVALLDTRHAGGSGTIGVYAVRLPAGGLLLVETGPGATLPQLERSLAAAGHEPEEIRAIAVTHIHLDHAGAAGALARRSGAPVWVHPRGAPHLADPSRLLASAARVYGDAMERLWGSMEPVPEAQLRLLEDDAEVAVGGLRLRAVHTPGHAGHHAALLLEDGTLFSGDAAGVRFGGSDVIRPALPPPEVDLEAWEASVARLRALRPQRLLLTHFGAVEGGEAADAHLARVPARNRAWADEVLTGLRAGEDRSALAERIAALAERELAADDAPEAVRERHRVTSDAAMTAAGLERYWRRHHPDALPGGSGEAR